MVVVVIVQRDNAKVPKNWRHSLSGKSRGPPSNRPKAGTRISAVHHHDRELSWSPASLEINMNIDWKGLEAAEEVGNHCILTLKCHLGSEPFRALGLSLQVVQLAHRNTVIKAWKHAALACRTNTVTEPLARFTAAGTAPFTAPAFRARCYPQTHCNLAPYNWVTCVKVHDELVC